MQFSKTALLLAILPFSIAATCDKASAVSWSTTSSGQAYDLSVCQTGCGTNVNCILACQKTACTAHCGSSTSSCFTSCSNDQCSAFYGSGSDAPNEVALQACYRIQVGCTGTKCRRTLNELVTLNKRTTLEERDTLTCSSSEGCYYDTKSTVFCLNKSTGDYHDDAGGRGNVISGAYTSGSSNGAAATSTAAGTKSASSTKSASVTNASTATSASVSKAVTAATAATTGASLSTSVTSTPAVASQAASVTSSSAAAASVTAKAGVEHLRANAAVGALGLVLGLVL